MTRKEQLRKDRGEKYGPVRQNHQSIGLIWTGILIQAGWTTPVLPPELATLMMVGVKCSREAHGHLSDNIDDGQNYLAFTGELSEEQRNEKIMAPDVDVVRTGKRVADPPTDSVQHRESDRGLCYSCGALTAYGGQHKFHCPLHPSRNPGNPDNYY